MKSDTSGDVPRALRRAPFALLAWVLSGLVPAELLHTSCRAIVLRALLDVGHAVRVATFAKGASKERAFLNAMEKRSCAAVLALGEDYGALTEEALPPPSADIDGPTAARVLFAFLVEFFEGKQLEMAVLALLTPAECEKLATRASAIAAPSFKKAR